MILVPYHEAKQYIREADVLLFRGKGLSSWLIKRYGSGVHSHAGVAHWDGDKSEDGGHLECVEFREFKGGRAVSMKSQVETHPDNIDVFRAATPVGYSNFTPWPDSVRKYDHTKTQKPFSPTDITDIMINLTGLPYGWKNIWKLARHYLPFCRLAPQNIKDDDPMNVFVCSTAVAYAYRQAYIDPVPYLADSAVMPADLARSALFKYQFTISKDW
tara:strand:+ start:60 stop:704 length:645 start_codon:yes stop_codon:yes gene_type:complete